MWNFLSCDAPALAGWSFRIFFGGPECTENASASQDQVFHMMDVMYGISAEFDFQTNLKWVENSTDRDVKQTRQMVKKIAGKDGLVSKQDFIKLVKKAPMLMMRIISAHTDMRQDCVGTKFWNAMAQQRQPGMSLDNVATKIENAAPHLLWVGGSGGSGGGGGGGSSESKPERLQSKYAVEAAKERSNPKVSKLDQDEIKAAQTMQNVMRSKAARKKVRKTRAVKQKDKVAEAVEVSDNGPWSEVWDPQYQAYYYYNNENEQCVWEKPAGFVSPSGN